MVEGGAILAELCQFQDKKPTVKRGITRPELSLSGGKGYRPKGYFSEKGRKKGKHRLVAPKKAALQMLIHE